jgi:hypothetical protein
MTAIVKVESPVEVPTQPEFAALDARVVALESAPPPSGGSGLPTLPPVWDALTAYPVGALVRGSDKIDYFAFAASTGVDPATENPRVKWFSRTYNSSAGFYGLAQTGPGGLASRREPLIYYGSQGMDIGSSVRPDLPMAAYHNVNKWRRDNDFLFNQVPPSATDRPHPGLFYDRTGYGAGSTFDIDVSTVLSPELRIQTGATSGAGGKLTAPYVPSGFYNPQAWNWVIRPADLTLQEIGFGIASADGQNKVEFRRIDTGSEGSWNCMVTKAGVLSQYNPGISTHNERIWFQIARNLHFEYGTLGVRFSIGTVSGEFPPGQNVLKERAWWYAADAPAAGTLMTPFLTFKNTAAANKTLYIWRMWFDLL